MIKLNAGHQYYDGEFKIVVKDKEGNIKQELDWQKNLLLENGMKILFNAANDPTARPLTNSGAVSSSSFITSYLFIGTGNSDPTIDQIALDNPVAYKGATSNLTKNEYEEPAPGLHEGFSKVSTTFTYTFNNFSQDYNITELGLACRANNINDYTLGTRALIKDNTGTALPVSILAGEILQVYYKINVYIDVKRKTGEFTLTKTDAGGTTTTETFEYFIQPINILQGDAYGSMFNPYTGYYKGVRTVGVKETDDELDASYSLNDDIYNSITYKDTSALDEKTTNSWLKTDNGENRTSNLATDYAYNTVIRHDYPTLTHTDRYLTGINTHNHANGIRAFTIATKNIANPASYSNGSSTSTLLVVVKNKANGQGIKKTNTYTWTLEWTYTMGRWEGD